MKSLLLIPGMLLAGSVFSQETSIDLNINQLCEGHDVVAGINKARTVNLNDNKLFVIDEGFCSEYDNMKLETSDPANKDKKDKWKLRFYASHSFTKYYNTDIKLRSSRYNVDIKNYEWQERSSREFFNPKTWMVEGNNPLQIIDEPTNTFTLSLEKNGHEIFLSAFHPKFLQNTNQTKYMQGTVDGVEVDGIYDINRPFDGYNQSPGEMELVRNQNTHMQMIFEVGYGYRFKLLETKFGSINYSPSILMGLVTGQNYTVVVQEGLWWDFDDYTQKNTIQGYGGSIINKIEFNSKNEKIGLFYQYKAGFYKQDHGFMDGTQTYDLKFTGHQVGLKFMINDPNKKKKKKKKAKRF
jgi:hypothetical protein